MMAEEGWEFLQPSLISAQQPVALKQQLFYYHTMLLYLLLLLKLAAPEIISPTQAALDNSKTQILPIKRSIDSIFLKLPSEQNLQDIIFSADSVALAKLIQTIEVKGADIPCDALAVYSDEVIGMIKTVLERKKLSSAQLTVIIEGARAQIQRINQELGRLNDEKSKLNLDSLRKNLQQLVAKLQTQYDVYNAEQKKIDPLQAQIEGYKKQASIIQKSTNQDRTSVVNDKLQISEIDAHIKKLEDDLANLRARRSSISDRVAQAQKRISVNEVSITQIQEKISSFERQVKQINDKSDQLKKNYIQLQIQVERLRTDIAVGTAKQNGIVSNINQLQQKLASENSKLADRQLNLLKSMIQTLNSTLPRFLNQNNDIYYNCFGDGSIDIIQTGSVIVFVIKGTVLPNYILDVYGTQPINQLPANQQISFFISDPFGTAWADAYGPAFQNTQLNESSAFVEGDFTCLNPSAVKASYGTISNISGNKISVKSKDGSTITLKIGACSRIESTSTIPRIGQIVYYKGVSTNSTNVNLYTASCF